MKTTPPLFHLVLLIAASISCLATAKADPAASVSAAGWTRVNDDDAAITYSAKILPGANDDYYDKDMHSGTAVGEWCTFSFTGTGVKWIGGKAGDHGKADVYLDGKLDATIDSTAPSWLKQQEIYARTGLSNGPHLFMLRIKTSGYQDVDAFEYQTLKPAPKMSAGKFLPEETPSYKFLPGQAPYLNPTQHYPLGNGVAMVVGWPTGEWSQLNGPGYSTPNFLTSEVVTLEIDGVETPLLVQMKRARKTGIYYGAAACGDLQVHLIDDGCWGQPWLSRLVMIDNTPGSVSHDVQVKATVKPEKAPGITQWLVENGEHQNCGVAIQADTSVDISGFGGKNVTNKSVVFPSPIPRAPHPSPRIPMPSRRRFITSLPANPTTLRFAIISVRTRRPTLIS
jgi:hypothetical protein